MKKFWLLALTMLLLCSTQLTAQSRGFVYRVKILDHASGQLVRDSQTAFDIIINQNVVRFTNTQGSTYFTNRASNVEFYDDEGNLVNKWQAIDEDNAKCTLYMSYDIKRNVKYVMVVYSDMTIMYYYR